MSGGVDSTVSAILLKEQGFTVHGVYMKNWDLSEEVSSQGSSTSQPFNPRRSNVYDGTSITTTTTSSSVCPIDEDWMVVQDVCTRLGIPCSLMNFSKDYWNYCFDPFLAGLQQGNTPNPDIACNTFIKFGAFYDRARKDEQIKADKIAFGHYAQVSTDKEGRTLLLKAFDLEKDQTYYLSSTNSSVLSNTIFPIGHLSKKDVKKLAIEAGFPAIASKKESMGICFIGKRKFGEFVQEFIEPDVSLQVGVGSFVNENGKYLGEFQRMSFYTIGQSAKIPGQKARCYVAHKDLKRNEIVVVNSLDHPFLKEVTLKVQINWIAGLDETWKKEDPPLDCQVKFRSRTAAVEGKVMRAENDPPGVYTIHYDQPQEKVSAGQQIAIYTGSVCMGGGEKL